MKVTPEDLTYSVELIAHMFHTQGPIIFMGQKCTSCLSRINVPESEVWFCVCGQRNVIKPSLAVFRVFDEPDYGPTRNTIDKGNELGESTLTLKRYSEYVDVKLLYNTQKLDKQSLRKQKFLEFACEQTEKTQQIRELKGKYGSNFEPDFSDNNIIGRWTNE
jgi:hypothetical protein